MVHIIWGECTDVGNLFWNVSKSKMYSAMCWSKESQILIADPMDMSLSKLWEMVKDREAWCAVVHKITKSWTWLSNWATRHFTYIILLGFTTALSDRGSAIISTLQMRELRLGEVCVLPRVTWPEWPRISYLLDSKLVLIGDSKSKYNFQGQI